MPYWRRGWHCRCCVVGLPPIQPDGAPARELTGDAFTRVRFRPDRSWNADGERSDALCGNGAARDAPCRKDMLMQARQFFAMAALALGLAATVIAGPSTALAAK